MTSLATFRSTISSKIGLDNSVAGDQGLIDSWVNEGVMRILLDTHCYVAQATLALISGSADYDLDANILAIRKVYNANSSGSYQMIHLSLDDLISRRITTTSTSGPARYYSLQGNNRLMFYPTPGSGESISIVYVPKPTALSATADDPATASLGGVPTQYQKAIEYWALSEAADFDDDASSQNGAVYAQKYEREVARLKKWDRRKAGARPARGTVNSTYRRIGIPHDPSTDLGY